MPTELITTLDKPVINRYLNSFRIAFSRYLKAGVGLQSTVFPFPNGAVIVIEVGFELQAKDLIRSDSASLHDALERTNLFAEVPTKTEIPGTFIILHRNKVLLIKNDEPSQWSQAQTSADIDTIFNSIKSRK